MGRIGRIKNQGVKETIQALIAYFFQIKQNVIIEAETATLLDTINIKVVNKKEIGKHCDLLIVVGGDGSLLHAAHAIINDETPVLGINRGNLGFLTDIHPTQFTKIQSILEGEYTLEKRFLLSAGVHVDHQKIAENNALNEVALIPDAVPHMNEFEIYIDDQFVCSQHSDGVIVATPTGSTAYALSGGGPILHPQLNAIVIVPMFPHTLSIRPLVIEGDRRITIAVSAQNNATPRLTCDGEAIVNTPPGSTIHIQKKAKCLHLIHPIDYNYYETLRSKLHWGHKLI